jgi:hypothetical protein
VACLAAGSRGVLAQDTVTWTPAPGTPNVNASFVAYPGGTSATNMIVLSITGPDILEAPNAGAVFTLTGPGRMRTIFSKATERV